MRRQLSASRLTLRRVGVTAAAALAIATGAVTLLAPQAHADSLGLTLPAPNRYVPVHDDLYIAGDTGYLHRRETGDGSPGPYQWRGYDGTERTVDDFTGLLPTQQGYYESGSDILPVPDGISGEVQLRDPATGESTNLTVPDGQQTVASFGTTVVSASYDDVFHIDKLHILRTVDGATTDTVVDPPDGMRFQTNSPVAAGDGGIAVVRFTHATFLGVLDLDSGVLTAVPANVAVDNSVSVQAAISPTHIAWYEQGTSQARVVDRADPIGDQTAVNVPASAEGTPVIGLAGDWLLTSYRPNAPTEQNPPLDRGGPLNATPLGGGSSRTLLSAAQPDLLQTPDGGSIAVGGESSGDWAVRRVDVASDGSLTLRTLDEVPPRPAVVDGIALSGGQLTTKEEDSAPSPSYQTRTVTLTGTPTAGDRSLVTTAPQGTDYGQPVGAGDGSMVHVRYDQATQRDVLVRVTASGERTEVVPLDHNVPPTSGLGLDDASGRYAVYGGGSQRVVVDFSGGGTVLRELNTSAAALWGDTLWTTDGTWGEIESRDLLTGTVTPYSVGAGCVIEQVQTVGRWVYWDCTPPGVSGSTDPFGVYDLVTGENIAIPARGRLGDGFVVNHDETAGKLMLTDFHTGTAEEPRVITDLPTVFPWKNWDVDEYGGGVAWLDASQAAHVVPSGVPAQPIAVVAARADTAFVKGSATGWNAAWQLSKPATGAHVTITYKHKVIRTLDATAAGAALTTAWDGTRTDGSPAAAGPYSWELTADPEDTMGAAVSASGTFTVTDSS